MNIWPSMEQHSTSRGFIRSWDIVNDPRLIRLMGETRWPEEEAIAHLTRLWWWAESVRPWFTKDDDSIEGVDRLPGDIPDNPELIAIVAGLKPHSGEDFVRTLRRSRFLRGISQGSGNWIRLADWPDIDPGEAQEVKLLGGGIPEAALQN